MICGNAQPVDYQIRACGKAGGNNLAKPATSQPKTQFQLDSIEERADLHPDIGRQKHWSGKVAFITWLLALMRRRMYQQNAFTRSRNGPGQSLTPGTCTKCSALTKLLL